MTVRAVEGKKPYTGGKAIEIDENKVINLRLRSENNLIIYDEGDNEIYVDLQLPDGIEPLDTFPVGITTGRVLVDDDWDVNGTIVCFKTTSGDNIKLLYGDDGKLYIDNGTGLFKQIYLKGEVDALLLALRQYVDQQLALKQDKLIAGQNIAIAADGKTISAMIPPLARFLSIWDCETGLPDTFPSATLPFEYITGDHYIVGIVDTTNTPPVNYRPDGIEFDGTASTVVESADVQPGDVYIYDGSQWLLQVNHDKVVTFAQIAGQPSDNTNLATALNAKQDELTEGFGINIDTNNNNEISVDTTDLDGFGLSSNGGTGVLDVDLDALDGFGLSVNGGTGLLDVDINSIIDTTNGHLDIDPSTSKVSVDMSDLTSDLAGFGLSQNPTASSYELGVDTYSIAGEYLSQNGSNSKLDVDAYLLASDFAGFGLGTDYNSSTGKYSLKVDAYDLAGFGLSTDSSGANTVLTVDTYALLGNGLNQGSGGVLEVDTSGLSGTGLQDNNGQFEVDIPTVAYALAGSGLEKDSNDQLSVDYYTVSQALAGSGLGVDQYNALEIDQAAAAQMLAGNGLQVSSFNTLEIDPTITSTFAGNGLQVDQYDALEIDPTVVQEKMYYVSSSAPVANLGDLWYDTTTDQLNSYDGSSWNPVDIDTTYTAGNGINIDANDEISVDTSVVATQTDINGVIKQGNNTVTSNISLNRSSTEKIVIGRTSDGAGITITEGSGNQQQYIEYENGWIDVKTPGNALQSYNFDNSNNGVVRFKDLSGKQDKLTASTGISIDANNNISNTLPGAIKSSTAPSNPSQGDQWYDTTNDELKIYDGSAWNAVGGGGGGDVVGPFSATDGHLAVFDGATGKLIKDGGVIPVGLSSQAGNVFTSGMTIWGGSSSDYSSLAPAPNTAYLII